MWPFKKKKEVGWTRHPLEKIQPLNLKRLTDQLQGLIKGQLWLKILIGVAAGVGAGLLLGPFLNLVERDTAATIGNWLAISGKLFLNLIQMNVIPLVFSSVIVGLGLHPAPVSPNHVRLLRLYIR